MRGLRSRVVVAVGVVWVAGCDDPGRPGGQAPDAAQADASLVDAPPVPPAAGPRCQGLPATCGFSGTDNCCNPASMIVGDMYYRSYDKAGDIHSGGQSHPATVSSFWLDKYEVTVGRFRAFVNAGKGTQASAPASDAGAHAAIAGSGWNTSWNTRLQVNTTALIDAVKCNATYQTWTDIPGANEERPMNCITWYEAMAFCIWDGGYLPTEAEWNYAATGGSEQRAYPWSSPPGSVSIDATRANYSSSSGTTTVGAKPGGDARWGQSDLAGNVLEWTLDLSGNYVTPCVDCAQVGNGSARMIRGGAFNSDEIALRAGIRGSTPPTNRYYLFGVRCARPLGD